MISVVVMVTSTRGRVSDGSTVMRRARKFAVAVVAEAVEEQLGGGRGAAGGAEVDARQRRVDELGDVGVVHPDDGDVVGDR